MTWLNYGSTRQSGENDKEGVNFMEATETAKIAHAFYHAHGDKAELEAAQRENHFREEGNEAEAENWRSIRSSIRRMRGANQS